MKKYEYQQHNVQEENLMIYLQTIGNDGWQVVHMDGLTFKTEPLTFGMRVFSMREKRSKIKS